MEHDLDAELGRLLHDERSLSLHQPSRPSWLCRACHQPWPCPRRWSEMAGEFGSRLDLACYLVAWLRDAINDHPDRAAELHGRFLSGLRTIRFALPTESASEGHPPLPQFHRGPPVPVRLPHHPGEHRDHRLEAGVPAVVTILPARARAWSATAPEGDVLAEATRLAALHQVDADGRCLACPGRPSGGCRDGEWGRAAMVALHH